MADLKYSEAAAKLPNYIPKDTDLLGVIDTTAIGDAQMQGYSIGAIKSHFGPTNKIFSVGPQSDYATVEDAIAARELDVPINLGTYDASASYINAVLALSNGPDLTAYSGRLVYYVDPNDNRMVLCRVTASNQLTEIPGGAATFRGLFSTDVFLLEPAIIKLEPGTHELTQLTNISLPSATWLQGSGSESTVIDGTITMTGTADALFSQATDSTSDYASVLQVFSDFSWIGGPLFDDSSVATASSSVTLFENLYSPTSTVFWGQSSTGGSLFSLRNVEISTSNAANVFYTARSASYVNCKFNAVSIGSLATFGGWIVTPRTASANAYKEKTEFKNCTFNLELLDATGSIQPDLKMLSFGITSNSLSIDLIVDTCSFNVYTAVLNSDYTAHIVDVTGASGGASTDVYLTGNRFNCTTQGTGTVTGVLHQNTYPSVDVYTAGDNIALDQLVYSTIGTSPAVTS